MEMIFPSNIKCVYCKMPIPKSNTYSLCKSCFEQIYFHRDEHICTLYEGIMVKLLHGFKYSSKTYLADIFAQMILQKMQSIRKTADLLISVPSSAKRLSHRGYNQSILLCESLSWRLGIPHMELFERVKDTAPLASMPPSQRAHELSGAFRLKDKIPEIQGKQIMLIDDILTTGQTIGQLISLIETVKGEIQLDYIVVSSKRA